MKILILIAGVLVMASTAYAVDMKPFEEAAYTFGIEDISHEGNVVNFTIPENARKIDKEADAVKLSGLYRVDKDKPIANCPVVSSYEVSKTVKNYDVFSGKATIKATFEDEKVAKAAFDQGCLLIDDPD